jgi:single-stranded DNA-binding protein
MESLNSVVLVGIIERDPTMRFVPASGMPCCVGTLRCDEIGTGGQTFRLYVPPEAYGRTAETLGTLTAGAFIGVQGKLAWRKREGEDKGSLVVMAQRISALLAMAAAV